MCHPTTRSERRFVREISRNKRRRIMKTWRYMNQTDLANHPMYWAGKQCVAHGNRCCCHLYKKLDIPKHSELKRMVGANMADL